jgi:hypothetical protein
MKDFTRRKGALPLLRLPRRRLGVVVQLQQRMMRMHPHSCCHRRLSLNWIRFKQTRLPLLQRPQPVRTHRVTSRRRFTTFLKRISHSAKASQQLLPGYRLPLVPNLRLCSKVMRLVVRSLWLLNRLLLLLLLLRLQLLLLLLLLA